jgi:hypothetical protein
MGKGMWGKAMGLRPVLRLLFGAVALAATAAPAAWGDDSDLCLDEIAKLETQYGMPGGLLKAIARVESSGSPYGEVTKPWPWTLNVGGSGHYYPNKEEAVAALTAYKAASDVNIDVGCMQISLRHHPNAFPDLATALDPVANVRYGALFLSGLKDSAGDWMLAAGRYHSSTPGFGDNYRGLVQVAMGGGRLSPRVVQAVRTTLPDGPAVISISQAGGQTVIRYLDTMGRPIAGTETNASGAMAGCDRERKQPTMSSGQGVRVWSAICNDGGGGHRITIADPAEVQVPDAEPEDVQ